MLQINGVWQIFLAVLGFIGLFTFALSYFRSSYGKQTIELLRGDIDDANDRCKGYKDDLDAEKEKSERKISELTAVNVALETQNSEKSAEIHVLRSIVTGKDQLDRIEKLIVDLIEAKIT